MKCSVRRFAAAIGSCVLAAGMADTSHAQTLGNRQQRVQVFAAEEANQNTATSLDIVLVFNRSALAALPHTASDWFGRKAQIVSSLSGGISVIALNVAPNSGLMNVALPRSQSRAIAIVSYANYLNPEGETAVQLPTRTCTRIVFGTRSVTYTECSW